MRLLRSLGRTLVIMATVLCVSAFAADPATRGVAFILVTAVLWASMVALGLRWLERREEAARIVGYRTQGDPGDRRVGAWVASAVVAPPTRDRMWPRRSAH